MKCSAANFIHGNFFTCPIKMNILLASLSIPATTNAYKSSTGPSGTPISAGDMVFNFPKVISLDVGF